MQASSQPAGKSSFEILPSVSLAMDQPQAHSYEWSQRRLYASYLYNELQKYPVFPASSDQSSAAAPPDQNQWRGFVVYENKTSASLEQRNQVDPAEAARMVAIIRNCYFESGIWTEADEFIEKLKVAHGSMDYPLQVLSHIANHNLKDNHILEGVLHVLSNYEYQEIDPQGLTIAIACTVNHSPVIQELLISCFENWESVDSIDIIKGLHLDVPWLAKYRDKVVAQIERKGQSA